MSSLMKLENAFLGLCKYEMFISAEIYAKYFFTIRKRGMNELYESIALHQDSELKTELLKYTKNT